MKGLGKMIRSNSGSMRNKAARSLVLASLLAGNLLASEGTGYSLDKVEMWGTAINSSSVSLGENQIEVKQAGHLSDLLRDIPGVDVAGTHSLNQNINIRGLSGDALDVRLDGAPQDIHLFHHFGDLRINADILKEANIQVGNNSIVNNGLGGGVRFKTMGANDLLRAGQSVSTTCASNSSKSASLAGYGRFNEMFDFLLYGNYINQETPKDGKGNKLATNEGDVDNILVKFGANLTDKQRLELTYDRFHDEGDYAARPNFSQGWATGSNRDSIFPTEYNREGVTLSHELDLGKALVLETTLYHSKNEISRWEGNSNGVTWMAARRDADIEGEGLNKGVTFLAKSTLETGAFTHGLTYGVEYQKQEAEQATKPRPSSTTATYQYSKEKRLLKTFYLEDRIEYGRFALIPGARYNDYERTLQSKPTQSWTEWTYALAGEVKTTENLTLKASYTELFRGPQLSEIFSTVIHNSTYNPDLKAQTGDNQEVGFVYRTKAISGIDELVVNGNLFKTTIDNYIDDYFSNNQNLGELTIKGFEVSANARLEDFDTGVSYARSRSKIDDLSAYAISQGITGGSAIGKDVGDSIGLRLGYSWAPYNLRFGWESTFVKEVEAFNPYLKVNFDKKSYNVHDVSVQWKPKGAYDGLTAILGIYNLFDEYYASHASVNGKVQSADGTDYEPGRNVKFTLSYMF